jgi:hypothetical protein
VPKAGLEPARPKALRSKLSVSAISPLGQCLKLVWGVGFEPTAPEFQARYSNQAELPPDAFSVGVAGGGGMWFRAGGLEPRSDAYKATASPSKLARSKLSSWLLRSSPWRDHTPTFEGSLIP